jgi:hypothetical protein
MWGVTECKAGGHGVCCCDVGVSQRDGGEDCSVTGLTRFGGECSAVIACNVDTAVIY